MCLQVSSLVNVTYILHTAQQIFCISSALQLWSPFGAVKISLQDFPSIVSGRSPLQAAKI